MVLAVALVAFASPASAQVFTGRIDVTIADTTGAVLPGVTVELTGQETHSAVTDASGEAHFLNLAPGTYAVAAKLQGFSDYMNNTVAVTAGGSVPLRVTLGVAGLASSVEVTAETPTIDPKKMTTSTNVTNQELQELPSSRDPWVVLQTVPGVIVDRVNVGGSESGQQSNFQAKGSAGGENTWNLDGITITDMAATGSSAAYYDFDMFEEMQVTTGGSDLQLATGGVGVNMVLKSGSNSVRGSGRVYFENEDMQANNLPDDLAATLGGTSGKGNRIKEYIDYGAEVGGPIFRDRLWAWGAYGKTDVTNLTLNGDPDQTILDNLSLKATGQVTQNLRASGTYFMNNKSKFGRNAGPTRPPETTWDQESPTAMSKGEGNLVVSDNMFLTARGAYLSNKFDLIPQGGLDTKWYIDDDGVSRGSFYADRNLRPQVAASFDGNYFRGRHELKFGANWRRNEADRGLEIPGYDGPNGIGTYHSGYPNMIADVWVGNDITKATANYTSAYLGDTISWDRLTVNAGVRWDRQVAGTRDNTQVGSSIFPQYLPDLTSEGIPDAVVYNTLSPRIGVTYALDEARKTIARASYSMFADQLGSTAGGFMSTTGNRGVYLYDVVDLNGNHVVDPEEVAGRLCSDATPDCTPYGFDIENPNNVTSPIHTVADFKTPVTHEFQLGLDREVFTNFGVSGTFTYRTFDNFTWRNNGVTGEDYQQIATLTGNYPVIGDYSVPIYGAIPANIPANRAATTFHNREGYTQRYMGFEASATKRLSNRWMARLGFSTNSHKEYFDSVAAMTDPTPAPGAPNIDGGPVVRQTAGSGKAPIFQILPSYQFIANGLYQAPWGINLAANMVSRQGFSMQYNRNQVVTADPLQVLKTVYLLEESGEYRLPAVTSLDLRVGKEFQVRRARLNVDLDMFNALNSATVLGREYNLRLAAANQVREIMNPRVFRVGLRVGF
ncbi:MAG: TonB-dependent receptor [Acidobacteriota bacterium]|nr:TonB-dependent receptor [Acidobacteriota bacterium]